MFFQCSLFSSAIYVWIIRKELWAILLNSESRSNGEYQCWRKPFFSIGKTLFKHKAYRRINWIANDWQRIPNHKTSQWPIICYQTEAASSDDLPTKLIRKSKNRKSFPKSKGSGRYHSEKWHPYCWDWGNFVCCCHKNKAHLASEAEPYNSVQARLIILISFPA